MCCLQVGDDLMLLYVISEEVLDHRTSLEINRFLILPG